MGGGGGAQNFKLAGAKSLQGGQADSGGAPAPPPVEESQLPKAGVQYLISSLVPPTISRSRNYKLQVA